jgi:hypothetical protein
MVAINSVLGYVFDHEEPKLKIDWTFFNRMIKRIINITI